MFYYCIQYCNSVRLTFSIKRLLILFLCYLIYSKKVDNMYIRLDKQEAQLMLTNPRDASRSPNMVPFDMLGILLE